MNNLFEISSATKKGVGDVNEDFVTVTQQSAWVIDGATGLTDRVFSSEESDGYWIAKKYDERIKDYINESEELSVIIQRCAEEIREEYKKMTEESSIDEAAKPSAAIALLRWEEDQIEYFVLGDCGFLAFNRRSQIKNVFGEGPRKYDEAVINDLHNLVTNEELEYEEAYEHVRPQLKEHRRLKNSPSGYWTLGLSAEAIDHADVGSLSTNEITSGLLMTDGFEVINTVFDVFKNWKATHDYLETNGLNRGIRVLRDIERGDPACRRYPRLKPSDDASVVILK